MSRIHLKRIGNQAGFSMMEVLIAALITGILAAASFSFYVTMNGQTITQQEISDMQQASRVTLGELAKSIRMAGYRLDSTHNSFEISADSIFVYYQDTNPVDTVAFFLQEFNSLDYYQVPNRPTGKKFFKLMRQENSDSATTYVQYVKAIRYKQINPSTLLVSLTTETSRPDDTWGPNGGYRTFTSVERVVLRNANL